MKIALLNDSHFGCHNASPIHDKHIRQFFDEVFFPLRKEFDEILHLGDVFDNRKVLNIESIQSSKEYFFDEVRDYSIPMNILVGNHDSFYKNTIKTNSPSVILREYENIQIISSPREYSFNEDKFGTVLLCPWICEENEKETFDLINATKAKVCFGHFEISGFKFSLTSEAKEGLSRTIFNKFDAVYSGHYHHRSSIGNIHYLGSQYDMSWADYSDPKYFHIYDTETGKIEAIENPNRLYTKIDVFDYKSERVEDKIVRLVVSDEISKKDIAIILDDITKKSPASFQIVDNTLYSNPESEETSENIDIDDSKKIISDYIEKTNIDDKMKESVRSILLDSLNNTQTLFKS